MANRLGSRAAALARREGASATLRRVTETYDANTRRTTISTSDVPCRALLHGGIRRNADGTLVRTQQQELSLLGLPSTAQPTEADRVIVGAATYLVNKAHRSSPNGATTIAWCCEVTAQ